jgi:uncharacterized caspase-like protein
MPNQFTHGHALLIGVDQNRVKKFALPDVAKDVAALREVLVHPERCAYPADHVKVLTGPDATRSGILDGLAWLQERVAADAGAGDGGNATAVVYYSGHGLHAGSSPDTFYLAPYDLREGRIASHSLRAADFAAEIEALNPRGLPCRRRCW